MAIATTVLLAATSASNIAKTKNLGIDFYSSPILSSIICIIIIFLILSLIICISDGLFGTDLISKFSYKINKLTNKRKSI